MSTKSIEVEGPTVADATELGLAALGLRHEDAVVDVLPAAGGGSGTGNVRIRVAARTEPTVSQETSAPQSSAEPRMFPGKQIVLDTFDLILRKLGISPRVSVEEGAENFLLDVIGDGSEILIGRHGQTLEAVEYLLNRIAGGISYDSPRVVLDVEGYRERREASLLKLAQATSVRVRETGRPVVLQPMSPRDRRIVHVALQGDGSVRTHSEGDGPFRTLVVSPARSSNDR